MSVYYYDVDSSASPAPAPRPPSREQRLLSGSLLDVSQIACDAGFSVPVAMSKEALRVCLTGLAEVAPGQCLPWAAARRVRSILRSAAVAVLQFHEDRQVLFIARADHDGTEAEPAFEVHLKLTIDTGTCSGTVATIFLPDQD